MQKLPWEIKGILLSAPRPYTVDLFEEFVEKKLAPGGCNLVILRVCYGYEFKSRPECTSPDQPLSLSHVKRIVNVCRKNNIKLIPKMNLLGHQGPHSKSNFKIDRTYGLLQGHPEFDETPDQYVEYCRSLCPNHPGGPAIKGDASYSFRLGQRSKAQDQCRARHGVKRWEH